MLAAPRIVSPRLPRRHSHQRRSELTKKVRPARLLPRAPRDRAVARRAADEPARLRDVAYSSSTTVKHPRARLRRNSAIQNSIRTVGARVKVQVALTTFVARRSSSCIIICSLGLTLAKVQHPEPHHAVETAARIRIVSPGRSSPAARAPASCVTPAAGAAETASTSASQPRKPITPARPHTTRLKHGQARQRLSNNQTGKDYFFAAQRMIEHEEAIHPSSREER